RAAHARRDCESVGRRDRTYTLPPVQQAYGGFTATIQTPTPQPFNSSTHKFSLIMLSFLLYTKNITSRIATQTPKRRRYSQPRLTIMPRLNRMLRGAMTYK